VDTNTAQKNEAAAAGTRNDLGSPVDKAQFDTATLREVRQALVRLKQEAEETNHNGFLNLYQGALLDEIRMVDNAIQKAIYRDLQAWRKANGHHYYSQAEAYSIAQERFEQWQAEQEGRVA